MRWLAVCVLAVLTGQASAQVGGGPVAGSPAPSQSPQAQQPAGGGGFGLKLSLKLGRKAPRPPVWESSDAVIGDTVPGQLIFLLPGNGTSADAITRDARISLIETTRLDAIDKTMAVAALLPGDSIEAASTRLVRLRGVEGVQPNFRFQPLGNKLPRRFTLIGVTRPEQLRASGTIAMIDTPVDLTSAELRGANISQRIFGTSAVPSAHGTAIASLIVGTGEVAGMAQGARLVSLAAFDPDAANSGLSQTRYLAKAMDAAWKLHPDVLNLLFGGREDPLLAQLLTALDRRGVCMAGAVGNGGPHSPVLFPARHPAVLAVTAADEKLRIYSHAARGPQVAVTGMGVGMLASVPGGYRQVSGTSFSAATISGTLMHLHECTAMHDPAAMRRRAMTQAQDLGTSGRDTVFGSGLLRLIPPAIK